jgi:ureidoglycolate hydrolase
MLNPEFNPYDDLVNLQQTQAQQAENMLKVSEWMMEISVAGTKQTTQIDHMFSMISAMNKQMLLLDQRIKLLEKHLLASINNTSSETQVPTWDL